MPSQDYLRTGATWPNFLACARSPPVASGEPTSRTTIGPLGSKRGRKRQRPDSLRVREDCGLAKSPGEFTRIKACLDGGTATVEYVEIGDLGSRGLLAFTGGVAIQGLSLPPGLSCVAACRPHSAGRRAPTRIAPARLKRHAAQAACLVASLGPALGASTVACQRDTAVRAERVESLGAPGLDDRPPAHLARCRGLRPPVDTDTRGTTAPNAAPPQACAQRYNPRSRARDSKPRPLRAHARIDRRPRRCARPDGDAPVQQSGRLGQNSLRLRSSSTRTRDGLTDCS
jgi:hypothetical protein